MWQDILDFVSENKMVVAGAVVVGLYHFAIIFIVLHFVIKFW